MHTQFVRESANFTRNGFLQKALQVRIFSVDGIKNLNKKIKKTKTKMKGIQWCDDEYLKGITEEDRKAAFSRPVKVHGKEVFASFMVALPCEERPNLVAVLNAQSCTLQIIQLNPECPEKSTLVKESKKTFPEIEGLKYSEEEQALCLMHFVKGCVKAFPLASLFSRGALRGKRSIAP